MTRWRRVSLVVLAWALSACSTLVRVPEAPVAGRGGPPIEAYARVLERFVNDRGEVDFSALARDRADLDAYVIHVAGTPFGDFAAGHERLAHYINAYNALSMYNVLDSGIPETHAGWRKVWFFYLKELVIGGRLMSLYAFENDVIRKLGEPRVHFALNCSARGCPLLPRAPFTARNLEEELDRETRRFFSEARNLRVDQAQRTVYRERATRFLSGGFRPRPHRLRCSLQPGTDSAGLRRGVHRIRLDHRRFTPLAVSGPARAPRAALASRGQRRTVPMDARFAP